MSCAGLSTVNSAQYEFDKGLSYFNSDKYKKAVTHFARATELDPEFARAYLYLGRSYINLGEWMNALEPIRTAYRISPAETKNEISGILLDLLFTLAIAEIQNGNIDKSKEFISEYLRFNSELNNSDNLILSYLVRYSAEEFKKGNLTNTINALNLALSIDPYNSDAYFGLARAYFKDGKNFQALDNLRKAILLDPENKEIQEMYRYFNQ